MPYVLAQLQVRYGRDNLDRYTNAFARLKPIFEESGVRLTSSMISQYGGRLFEVWNLWEVDDAAHMERARAHLRGHPAYPAAHADLAAVLDAESVRYLHTLPIGEPAASGPEEGVSSAAERVPDPSD